MRFDEHDLDDEHPYRGPDRRAHEERAAEVEPVVLRRKLADLIDGVDLTGHDVGDRLPLSRREAGMLIAEGWAEPTPAEERRRASDESCEHCGRRRD